MRYISSRGSAPKLNFNEVLLTGLARDKGLYIPESWPEFSLREISSWRGLSYPELAEKIIKPFVGDCISDTVLKSLISSAYSSFNNSQIAPLNLLESGIWVMELFHGPTMSFKDIAMQFLGKTFDHVLQEREETITIIGATSGDTGSAAIAACSNKPSIELFMLHPLGRISEIQRRQMTTMLSSNIHNIALIGTFDDCQDRVKDLFNDMLFRDRWHLSAVNSINWGRIMAQIVYYFWGALKVGGPEIPVAFSIPTGNFGNIFACKALPNVNLERKSVCSGVSQKVEAFALSDEIKNRFKGYDFSYHTKHLKQISEPDKVINRNITCSSSKT